MTRLEVFTDFVCPWCYLSTGRVERLKRDFEIDVRWVGFPLHPETPMAGISLAELFAGRDLRAVHDRLQRLMDDEGLPYGPRTHTYNTRLAQELAAWADTQPGGGAVHAALYRAYFVEGRNIGDVDVLVAIAASSGLPADTARTVLEERRFKDAVDVDWSRARDAGVTGVPTFFCGGYRVVGAQPYDVLTELVIEGGARRRGNR